MKNLNRILQITAGKGPVECTWVVAQVLKKIIDEAQSKGIKTEVLHRVKGLENGTIETALVRFSGKEVAVFVEDWVGSIQWIGKSTFRKLHKRKNWFIGIQELPTWNSLEFNDQEVEYQAIRSSGAGGQHVNKVSSAIRATHKPTGMSVVSMDNRSQHQNKKLALERLKIKVLKEQEKELLELSQLQWKLQSEVERGNPKRTFEGSDFKKKTVNKTYKKTRLTLKQNLKNENS